MALASKAQASLCTTTTIHIGEQGSESLVTFAALTLFLRCCCFALSHSLALRTPQPPSCSDACCWERTLDVSVLPVSSTPSTRVMVRARQPIIMWLRPCRMRRSAAVAWTKLDAAPCWVRW